MQVHEIEFKARFALDFPTEAWGAVQIFDKVVPFGGVGVGIGVGKPDSKNIVDKTTIKKETVFIVGKEAVFLACEEDIGVGWGGRRSHSGASCLQKRHVHKCEDAEVHYKVQGFEDCFAGVGLVNLLSVFVNFFFDALHASIGWYVGVHGSGIGRKEAGIGWEVKREELLLETEAIFKIRRLALHDDLEFVVDPSAETEEEASWARNDRAAFQFGDWLAGLELMRFERRVEASERFFIAFQVGAEEGFF